MIIILMMIFTTFHLVTSVIVCRTENKLFNLKKPSSLFLFILMQVLWFFALILIFLAPAAILFDWVLIDEFNKRKLKKDEEQKKLNEEESTKSEKLKEHTESDKTLNFTEQLEKEFLDDMRKVNSKYSLEDFKGRIENAFAQIRDAEYDSDNDKVHLFLSDGVFNQLLYQNHSADLADKYFELISINAVKLEIYSENYIASFAVTFKSNDNRGNTGDESSSGNLTIDTEIWTFMKKIKRVETNKGLIEGFCPKCGNYIEEPVFSICHNCKAFFKTGKYDWILIKIQKASDWDGSALPKLLEKQNNSSSSDSSKYSDIFDWVELKEKDPDFNVLNIVDILSVKFWQIILSIINNDTDDSVRFQTLEVTDYMDKGKDKYPDFSYYERVSINSINILGYIIDTVKNKDMLIGEIIWRGSGYNDSQFIKETRSILLLRRDIEGTTDKNSLFSSLHCSYCGLLKDYKEDNRCSYCHKPLLDTKEWFVTEIYNGDNTLTFEGIINKTYRNEKDWIFDNRLNFNKETKIKIKEYYSNKKNLKKVELRNQDRDYKNDYSDSQKTEIVVYKKKKFKDKEKRKNTYDIDWSSLKKYSKTDLLRLTIAVMLSDGITDSSEFEEINNICRFCSITEEEFLKINFEMQSKIDPVDFAINNTASEIDKNFMFILVLIAASDGKISEEEIKALKKIANRKKFSETKLMEIIKSFQTN